MLSEKLVAELGLPVFVTMPNIQRLIDELGGSIEKLKKKEILIILIANFSILKLIKILYGS